MSIDITVVVPTIPPRKAKLQRALASIEAQLFQPAEIIVEVDLGRRGAARTRQTGLEKVETDWVAFLDDDDWMYEDHLAMLSDEAIESGADLVYPWFDIVDAGGRKMNHRDPLMMGGKKAFGQPFNEWSEHVILTKANFIPVTVLAATEVIRDEAGGFPEPGTKEWPHRDCEDWGCWQAMLRAGASFHHVPKRTWAWCWDGKNTSGRPDRW